MPTSEVQPAGTAATGFRSRGLRIAGSIVGFALFAAAAWVAWGQRGTVMQAWRDAGNAPWYVLAALLVLPVVGWSLTAIMYFFLMNRDRFAREGVRCGLVEMHTVLGAAWLFNYAPARPGMFARIAYHTTINRFPLSHVLASSVVAIICGGVSLVLLTIVCIAAQAYIWRPMVVLAALTAPAMLMAFAAWGVRQQEKSDANTHGVALARVPAWRVLAGASARYLDCLVWLARYACVFHVLRVDLSLTQLVAITAISQAAALVPFIGAGLGVREWAIGLLGPILPGGTGTTLVKATGIAGDVINRAAELLAALVVGLPCVAILGDRLRIRTKPPDETNAG